MNIEGSDKLLKSFRFFPVFHDSEVVSIVLDRDSLSAIFTLLIPRYVNGEYREDVKVTLKFSDIEKLRLENFNYQNVVSSLTFEAVVEKTEYSNDEMPRVHVDLDTNFGVWSTFTCSHIEVQDVITGIQPSEGPPYLASKTMIA